MMDRQRRRRLRRLELWHALRLPKHRRPALGTEVEGRKLSDDRVAGKSFRPASYNFYRATLEKAAMPSALPVRRWQSTQWRIETRLGSPAQRICGRPQAQLATRCVIENFRRAPLRVRVTVPVRWRQSGRLAKAEQIAACRSRLRWRISGTRRLRSARSTPDQHNPDPDGPGRCDRAPDLGRTHGPDRSRVRSARTSAASWATRSAAGAKPFWQAWV